MVNDATFARLQAEKEDLVRRIHERDERSSELQKQAHAAQHRAHKAAEALAVQQAERALEAKGHETAETALRNELREAEERMRLLQTRADRADGAADALRAALEAACSESREMSGALSDSQRRLAEVELAAKRAADEAADLRATSDQRHTSHTQSMGSLESDCERLRAEVGRLEQALAASRAEVRSSSESAELARRQLTSEREVCVLHGDGTVGASAASGSLRRAQRVAACAEQLSTARHALKQHPNNGRRAASDRQRSSSQLTCHKLFRR